MHWTANRATVTVQLKSFFSLVYVFFSLSTSPRRPDQVHNSSVIGGENVSQDGNVSRSVSNFHDNN